MTPPGHARAWLAELLELFLPTGCISCRSWIPSPGAASGAELVCLRCRARLRAGAWPRCPRCHAPRGTGRSESPTCRVCASWPEILVAARFAYELAPPADDLVHGLKYEGWRELAITMGAALARVELPAPGGPAEAGCAPEAPPLERDPVVVPVPTTPARLRERGYNQASLLAAEMARRRGWSVADALLRPSERGSQTSLGPTERALNVREAFVPGPGAAAVTDRVVVLVDDVLTTGATAAEAALVLGALGCRAVVVLSYARATDGARSAA